MKSVFAPRALACTAALAALLGAGLARAEPPAWTSARAVKATHTQCGSESYLVLKGLEASASPTRPGCTSFEEIYFELDVATHLVSKGGVAETNVDARTLMCGNRATS